MRIAKVRDSENSQSNFEKEDNIGEFRLSDFNIYYEAALFKTVILA